MRPLLIPLLLFPTTLWSGDERLSSGLLEKDLTLLLLGAFIALFHRHLAKVMKASVQARLPNPEQVLRENQLRETQALLHMLTHDLAGPLFVIQSMAELQIDKPQLDAKAKQAFAKIKGAAQSAQSMLKVIKELEAIEAGKTELFLKPVPLLASLKTTIDILKTQAEAKQVQILLEADIPESLRVIGERTVLEHTIFHNVVANAIKFSKAGERIEIRLASVNADRVGIAVKDHGIGIPRTLITQLFSHQCPTSRRGTSGEKGTGLGLPLAQRYAQKFGGLIEVASQACEDHPDDHWTEFTVTLKKAG
jgi:signal transduction histidine kinase